VFLPALDLVNALNCLQINGIDSKSIESVGRYGDHVAFAQTGDDIVDPVSLWFIGMDAQNLRGQEGLPQFPVFIRPQRRKLTQPLAASKLIAISGAFAVNKQNRIALATLGFAHDACPHCT
jgi:hypothetical protein